MEGRVALVTGGARGIGRAIAWALAERGAEVVVTARAAAAAESAAAELVEAGHRARGVPLDVADRQSIAATVAGLLESYGRIPLLVNNAGVTRDNLLLRMSEDEWNGVLETNLGGVFRLSKALLPSMVRARYGRIVNIGSVVAATGNPGQANYCASKAAIEGFTRALAREVASRNVTVNCVAPGFIDTEMTRTLAEPLRARLLEQVPLGRLGTPADVAAATAFLLGPEADYITGITLYVNGGMYM
jgi:3-oxoacyl-[acyl-carrier protein] reductase